MGFWLFRKRHAEAWAYLRESLRPDLALIQEAQRPQAQPGESVHFREIHQGWGTAVYSHQWPLVAIDYESDYPSRVAAATALLPKATNILLASIHAPIISNRVFPHLARIVGEIERLAEGQTAIIGGDLNSARLMEEIWPGYGHGPFFEHMDQSRFLNCYWHLHSKEVQTYFRPRSKQPFQDDHVFITKDLATGLKAWVDDNSLTRSLSDHVPLVVEIELPS